VAHRTLRRYLRAARRTAAAVFRGAPRPRRRLLGGRRIIADGLARAPWTDVYYDAMTASWSKFFGALAVAFVALNLVFAAVYELGGEPIANARPGSFSDLFFFSVETTSTVGYGDMHPQTFYGHVVATVENFIGMAALALMTGMIFARFSRPRARLAFSKHPVIAIHEGAPTLFVRVANARDSFISEATARMWTLRPVRTAEGRRYFGFQPMRLIKSENPALALTWTLFHPIDADSPLHGVSADQLSAAEMNFIVVVSGYDETSAQRLRARHTFTAQDVRPDHEFVDIIGVDENGVRHVDYGKLHEIRPVARRADSLR